MITEDETGRRWLVLEGDPAYTIVDKLNDKGMKYLAITQRAIQTGSFGAFEEADFDPYPALKAAAELRTTSEKVADLFLASGKRKYQIRQAARLVGEKTGIPPMHDYKGVPGLDRALPELVEHSWDATTSTY